MNLKAIIQTIVLWFKGEAKAVEPEAIVLAEKIGADAVALVRDDALQILSDQPAKDTTMSTPAAAPAAPATTNTTVDTAIKIALALKAIDANLTDAAVQAGTNAALATLYPAA